MHAAGHSPGHLAFAWPERRFAIVGDGVATWPQLCPGWHAFNLNKKQHHVTLQRLAALEPTIVGVGHGDPITQRRCGHAARARQQAGSLTLNGGPTPRTLRGSCG